MEWVLWRHIVMPWRHSVPLWHVDICKYRIDDIFKLGNPEYYRNKKRIISLARLQAEIGAACLITSWRHFLILLHHANTMTITKLSSATKEITETEMESALEHICRLRWRQFVSWRHVITLVTSWRHVMTWRHHASTYTIIAWNPATEISTEINVYHHFRTSTSWCRISEFCDVMTSRHDVMTSCKHKNDNIFELGKPENYKNKKKNYLASTSTSWDRVQPVFDVMTWRHDVTSLCKYKTDNFFKLSNPKYHRNRKRIIFLAHLQAEIGKISLVTSCRDVMTSRCHAVGLNRNLSTVSCEWDMELWKNGTFRMRQKFSHIK